MGKKKRLSQVLVALVLSITVFTGCAKGSDSGKTVIINFWHHYSAQSAENQTLIKVLIPEFEKQNPGIKVNAVSHEWANLHDKILVSAKSGTLPDLARLDSAWIPEFEKSGMLVALDKDFPDFGTVADSLLESAMSTAKIGSHFYGLALNTNTKILFYNVQALKKAGVSVPKTLDQFREACMKLSGTNENGQRVWGYMEPSLSGWNLCPFIWSNGGELTDGAQKKASGYINSPNTVAAINLFASLASQNAITGWNSGDIPMTDGFGTGRYLMILEGPWKIAELAGAYPSLEYGTAPMPAGSGGSHSVLGGENISMFKTANQDASWAFMKFMTNQFAQEEMAKCGQIPVNIGAIESETVKKAAFAPFIEALVTAKSRPTVSSWSEIDGELSAAVSSVLNGKKTAQAAMEELAITADTLLSK